MLDPRYAAPELTVMSAATPDPPSPVVAAFFAPALWRLNTPDRFDVYSIGLWITPGPQGRRGAGLLPRLSTVFCLPLRPSPRRPTPRQYPAPARAQYCWGQEGGEYA